ncbi:beta-lactamase family protein [Dactylosporangium aurantiacum]|uniref:Beta-lactamase family protein n=1 Tax=Dactylosporangium aurantiacum TaxID=35754 RepID=A0A9Q9IPP9_9ACTN|nr:serine hydrolase domain-containing protein [Dactylosporangium aurantiacum]MDG6103095.1 serine hydrolase [Dactylosporangium aurantiacum]UWZ57607.1 beta-lactamase family protein [Dactylosporangium aurantiacum]
MNEIAQLSERIAAFCDTTNVPGYVAGVYRAGERHVLAHGVANIGTGAPMREDTGFLFGSITKVMTTMLVLRQVERGTVDLDAPVVSYLPEFALATLGRHDTAGRIRVRHLLTHTSGIDADLFFPAGCGPDALRVYLAGLARRCGTLFEPGEHVSYSNGGMMVAGRLLEVVTGTPYHELLRRDLYGPAGMTGSCTSAAEAILRGTAVGHFADPTTGEVRRTGMFTLPDTWAPAGGTAIGTVGDLLALGRQHLTPGVLSAASTALMRTVSHDMGTPNVPPVGMGWLLMRFGDTTVMTMSGASPGGVAVLAVAPELDLVFAAYGNDPRALALHDELLPALVPGPLRLAPVRPVPAAPDLARYAGTYRSDQLRVEVSVVDGGLEERITYEPADAVQEATFTGFVGGPFTVPPRRYTQIGDGLFAPAGMPPGELGLTSRQYLVSFHGHDIGTGAVTHRCSGGRMTRRVLPDHG